jgi:hypothetical protein
MANHKRSDFLTPIVKEYDGSTSLFYRYAADHRVPPFTSYYIDHMLRDTRIRFGLWMIKGPLLSRSRFYIKDSDSRPGKPSPLKQHLINAITRFWRNGAEKSLSAIEWGFSGAEVLYSVKDDLISYDSLRLFNARDVRVVTKAGIKTGVVLRNVPGRKGRIYLGGPKSFWHVHQREINQWYGESRLFPAFPEWIELHADGGARDVRRLYYAKYAYNGDTLYYPVGSTPDENGNPIPNQDIARDIMAKRKTGGIVAIPNTVDPETGQREWELVPGGQGGSTNVLDYPQFLRREMFDGMGIPNEVVEAAMTGSGFSGRAVPQDAFYGSLQSMSTWLINDFDEQILRPSHTLNGFGSNPEYEIIPFGLLTGTLSQDEMERKGEAAQEELSMSLADTDDARDEASDLGLSEEEYFASRYSVAV